MATFFVYIDVARDPRFIDNESGVVEISTRTLHGHHFLRPSRQLNELVLGIIGKGQALYPVKIYALIVLSNHYHMLMRVLNALQMARFVGYVNGNIAKEVGKLIGWRQKFWGRRYHHFSIADSPGADKARFKYILSNSCKESLVSSPLDWPGVTSARALANGKDKLVGTWFDRTQEYRKNRRTRAGQEIEVFPSMQTVKLAPLPSIEDMSVDERQHWYVTAVREVEEETAQMHRSARTRPMGVPAILRQNPLSKPKDFESSPAPKFFALTREEFEAMRDVRRSKVNAYREAARRLKEGELDARFPEGCFPPRLPFVESRAPT